MTLRKSRLWIYLFALIILIGVIVPNYIFGEKFDTSVNLHIGHDYPVALDLAEMADGAQVIVIGKYKKYMSSWNMARNPENILEEDTDNYVEGHLYEFEVDEVLKGNLSQQNIIINQRFSEQHQFEGQYFMLSDPLFIAPELEIPYMLFLSEDEDFECYYGAIEPFSIAILPDDTVALQSNLINNNKFEESIILDDRRTINVSIQGHFIKDTVSGRSLESILREISKDSE